jgi:hypothetical protein
LKEIGRFCIGLRGQRASFAGNQARNRRPRHAPMLSARKIQHQAGDHASIGKPVIAMHP